MTRTETNSPPSKLHGLQATLCSVLLCLTVAARAEGYNHFDPRAHSNLDQVVALCAIEPGSQRFAQAWLNWLAENPQADVYRAVETVVSRAGTVRSIAVPGMQPRPRGRQPDPDAIAERMLSLAGKPTAR